MSQSTPPDFPPPNFPPSDAPRDNPWGSVDTASGSQASRAGRHAIRGWLLLLGSIAAVVLVICSGVGFIGYRSLSQFAEPEPPASLSQRQASYGADLQRFNDHLAGAHRSMTAPREGEPATDGATKDRPRHPREQEVRLWFEQVVSGYLDNRASVPTSKPMFMEACRASHVGQDMSLRSRMNRWKPMQNRHG